MTEPAIVLQAEKLHNSHSHHEVDVAEHDKGLQPLPVGGGAHLFREDSSGAVLERFLVPCPTNDPKDPLTWSIPRKHLVLASISSFVFLSNYITASISPVLIPIVEEFGITLTQGTYLITFNILFLGIGNLFWIPLSLKIGKRPVIILSSGIFFAACIWNAKAKSYGSLLASRIIQGFGASSSEALGPAIVADLYFLHERGGKIGFYTLMIAGGSSLGSIFGGLVTTATTDWRWVFWMDSIVTGVSFLFICAFQAETNFCRPAESESGGGSDRAILPSGSVPMTWTQSLGLFGWYDRENSFINLFLKPWAVSWFPAVVWSSIVYGICLGWVVLQQTANSSFFPRLYGFSGVAVGNISIANLIGAIIGCAEAGPLSDYIIAIISKRRQGYFQPEYRLWLLIIPFMVFPIGLLLWGGGLQNHLSPYVAIAGSGITYGVLAAVPAVSVTYVVDCYRPLAGETVTIMTAFKNTFAFGLSFGVIPWLTRDGFLKAAGYMTLIEGVMLLTAIPMYIYGERVRIWTYKRI